jgi:hypothetical protein
VFTVENYARNGTPRKVERFESSDEEAEKHYPVGLEDIVFRIIGFDIL